MSSCPSCGLAYRDFRTGLTFGAVRAMMYVDDPDPSTWRYKRRSGVLGYWHGLKRSWWRAHLEGCYSAQQAA